MQNIAVVFGECNTILLAFFFLKVKRFPKNKPYQTIYRVITACEP